MKREGKRRKRRRRRRQAAEMLMVVVWMVWMRRGGECLSENDEKVAEHLAGVGFLVLGANEGGDPDGRDAQGRDENTQPVITQQFSLQENDGK